MENFTKSNKQLLLPYNHTHTQREGDTDKRMQRLQRNGILIALKDETDRPKLEYP